MIDSENPDSRWIGSWQIENDPVLTIDELATYLEVSKSTLHKPAQEGKVPGQRVGRHWRFRKDAIDARLNQSGDSDRGIN